MKRLIWIQAAFQLRAATYKAEFVPDYRVPGGFGRRPAVITDAPREVLCHSITEVGGQEEHFPTGWQGLGPAVAFY